MDLETWRINYGLDREPHDLAEFWRGYTPTGAVLALKAAVEEIERLQAQLAEAQAAINQHNGGCDSACKALRDAGRCKPYLIRNRTCPDCPKDWRIEEALTGEEGE